MDAVKRLFRRILALALVLLLIPVPAALAEDASTVFLVTCRDAYHAENEKQIPILETADGYYIRMDAAAHMLDLQALTDGYFTANGQLLLFPETNGLDKVLYEGETWYALEQLMDVLQTTVWIHEGTGELYYVSVPVNQDLLMVETQRIMENGGYTADVLADMPGLEVLYAFANVSAFVQKPNLEALMGNDLIGYLYKEHAVRDGSGTLPPVTGAEYGTLMLELLAPIDDGETLLGIVESGVSTIESLSSMVLNFQKDYDLKNKEADFFTPVGEKLLFGVEGTESYRSFLDKLKESNEIIEGQPMKFTDFLSAAEQILSINKGYLMYADGLQRVLGTHAAENFVGQNLINQAILDQGLHAVVLYNARAEDDAGILANEGIYLLLQNWLNDYCSTAIPEPPVVKGLKAAGSFLDKVFQINTAKKVDFVRQLALYNNVQPLFEQTYIESVDRAINGEASLVMRDSALLYIKCAYEVYNNADFHSLGEKYDISGVLARIKKEISQDTVLLAGFVDGMFLFEGNEPLEAGILSRLGVQEQSQSGYPAFDGKEIAGYEAHYKFLEERAYVNYISDSAIRESCVTNSWYSFRYCFHDVDKNGTVELILWFGLTGDTGEVLVISFAENGAYKLGSIPCSGLDVAILGSSTLPGLVLYEYHGGSVGYTKCDMDGSKLVVSDMLSFYAEENEAPPASDWYPLDNSWYTLEEYDAEPAEDSAPAETTVPDEEPETIPEETVPEMDLSTERGIYSELLENQSYVVYLQDDAIVSSWVNGNTQVYHWVEDIENDGVEELILWMGSVDDHGEVLVFTCQNGGWRYVDSVPCISGKKVSISGSTVSEGFLLVENDGGLECISLCQIRAGKLEVTENYMIMEEGWSAAGTIADAPGGV